MLIFNFYMINGDKINLIASKKSWKFLKEDLEKRKLFQVAFKHYYESELCPDKDFMNLFNTERTYYIGIENEIIGFLNMHKGYTVLDFMDFDYRKLIQMDIKELPQPPKDEDDNPWIEPIYPDNIPPCIEPIVPIPPETERGRKTSNNRSNKPSN